MAQATFCADIRKLLKAVSVIMAADERRQGLEDGSANINFADTTEGASFPLSEVSSERASYPLRIYLEKLDHIWFARIDELGTELETTVAALTRSGLWTRKPELTGNLGHVFTNAEKALTFW